MAKRKQKKLWSKKSDYTCADGTIVSMDSTWEVAMAERLDAQNIKWIRDSNIKLQYLTKGGRKRNYEPDFYLPELDLYIEVKGYWTDRARHKMQDICKRYPDKICILESLDEIANLPLSPRLGTLNI
jgi:predicted nuclease of restriction endonuclease-like RecB superfamily